MIPWGPSLINTTEGVPGLPLIRTTTGLPMMHDLRVFDTLEPKFTPFKFVLCGELTL